MSIKYKHMEHTPSERFLKAKASVGRIKRFYKHLMTYIVVNLIIFIIKLVALRFFMDQGITDQGFLDWFRLNVILTPILWGIGVFFHGLLVFKYPNFTMKLLVPSSIKKWEERQIKKYLEEDNKN